MNIIIVGCGQVGQALASELNEEHNNITVVDTDRENVKKITDRYDVMGVIGNGASHSTLVSAGIDEADLLIAVTGSDELNLLCCILAKRSKNLRTIARVRSHEYLEDTEYLKKELGLAMLINPEYMAAREIARILRFPSATNIDTFGKGRVELISVRLPEDSRIVGMSVREVAAKYKSEVLFATVDRDGEAIIVKGDLVFEKKDVLTIIASPQCAVEFFKKIGYKTEAAKSAIIVGSGELTHYLLSVFKSHEMSFKLIEKNKAVCKAMSSSFPSLSVIHADPRDEDVLVEEGIDSHDAFLAFSSVDEENILSSLFARSRIHGKVVTKINRLDYDGVIKRLDLDTVIYPKDIISDMIVRYVRAAERSLESNMETLYKLMNGKIEASEFIISQKSTVTDTPISELKIKSDVLIGAIIREGEVIIPRGQDCLLVGDGVIVVSKAMGMSDITDIIS